MAHIIKEDKIERLSVFVILFPNENSFFVWKAAADKLKAKYKYHYYCGAQKTKNFFRSARECGQSPPMYCLETIETTQEKAFLHCIAWAKYFIEKGYASSCGEFLDKYTENLGAECKQIFDGIKEKSIEEVCPPGGDLFPDFGRKIEKQTESKNNKISFRVTEEEYVEIQKRAATNDITVSEYCKKMALNERVIVVSKEVFEDFSEYVNEFIIRDRLLKDILIAIRSQQNYFPVDLEIIQQSLTDNAQQQEIAFHKINEVLKKIME